MVVCTEALLPLNFVKASYGTRLGCGVYEDGEESCVEKLVKVLH
jgi:hypothetical protein